MGEILVELVYRALTLLVPPECVEPRRIRVKDSGGNLLRSSLEEYCQDIRGAIWGLRGLVGGLRGLMGSCGA